MYVYDAMSARQVGLTSRLWVCWLRLSFNRHFRLESVSYFTGLGGYCYQANLIDFPAAVVPFGKISAEEEQNDLRCYPESNSACKKMKLVSKDGDKI